MMAAVRLIINKKLGMAHKAWLVATQVRMRFGPSQTLSLTFPNSRPYNHDWAISKKSTYHAVGIAELINVW